jgi:putative glutamine amidotransferase
MRRPQIGISLTLDDRGRWREGRSYHYIDRSYADAIDRAGGLAVQLPIQSDPEALVRSLDGLLSPGGDDFPSDDGLPVEVELDLISPDQLAFDEALFEAARRRGLPILGICYGMQLMARQRGGALVADLPTQRPDANPHVLAEAARHSITVDPASNLFHLLGRETLDVNSLHHQAVSQVGPEHRAVAHGSDGVIEAIERISGGTDAWELGVQWHPEKMSGGPDGASSEAIFRGFIAACLATERAT